MFQRMPLHQPNLPWTRITQNCSDTNFTLLPPDPPVDLHCGVRELFRLFSLISFTAQPLRQMEGSHTAKVQTGGNTRKHLKLSSLYSGETGMPNAEGKGCLLQPNTFQSLTLLSSAQHHLQNPFHTPSQISFACACGQGRVWPPNLHSM